MAMPTVPCAASPSFLRATLTPPVPPMVAQITCHGVPPHRTMTETKNTASAQVNVSLIIYSAGHITGQKLDMLGALVTCLLTYPCP